MWIVYSSWPSAFILLNSLQIKEKKEHVNLICVSLLYALPKFSSSSDSMSETVFSVWLGRDFFVSSPWSIQLDYRDLFFFFFFHYFSQISHLNFYCTMCCSSARATFSLQVSQRHMHPSLQKNKPKQKIHQVLNSNSTFTFLVLLLCTSDFRAGFYVALYPV